MGINDTKHSKCNLLAHGHSIQVCGNNESDNDNSLVTDDVNLLNINILNEHINTETDSDKTSHANLVNTVSSSHVSQCNVTCSVIVPDHEALNNYYSPHICNANDMYCIHTNSCQKSFCACNFTNKLSYSDSSDDWFSGKGLNIVHLNIHYLYPKIDEIRLLASQHQNIDIFCFCETFLNDTFSDNEIILEGFNIFRKDRNSLGGGLVLYVKETVSCIQRPDLESDNVESIG